MLWSMTLAEDIAAVVNNPWGAGAPHRFELTAELAPGWIDDDLDPDTSDDYTHLFYTEAQIQEMTDPDAEVFYNLYHPRGSGFLRDVGRKWVLNETGRYSVAPQWAAGKNYRAGDMVYRLGSTYRCTVSHASTGNTAPPDNRFWVSASHYDRGTPFDFSSYVPKQYSLNSNGKRAFAPFPRQLLPCLTVARDSEHSAGILVEFSFDGGTTWQVIPASISSLKDECGIYIAEPNLAEMVDENNGTISSGLLSGGELNYWTRLCADKLDELSFKDEEWKTRVRVTASVQLDQRLARQADLTTASGSPFRQTRVYDFSQQYHLAERTSSSRYAAGSLASMDADDTDWFDKHLNAIRQANQDMSISGQFTLERLWLGDGSGSPDFKMGDCIEQITGREYNLSTTFGGAVVYPEIIKIIYMPDRQQMKLITRDLRFAEVTL